MGLKEVLSLQRRFGERMDALCKRPIANSQEEVDKWQKNNIEYLQAKSKNVEPIPSVLENDIDMLFEEHKKTYYSFVENWYEHGYKDFKKAVLFSKLKDENISDNSKEEIRNEYKQIEDEDISNASQDEKINYFFFVFENIIDAIKNHKNWFDIYKGSSLRGDGLVWNISSLDLFAWQLPNADLRNKNNYKKIAMVMVVFFFIEKIYKNEYSLSNKIDPFDEIMNLDKIVSYYYFVKEGK